MISNTIHNDTEERMAKKPGTVTVRRSSVTGKFVKPSQVKRNPRETETERRPTKKAK